MCLYHITSEEKEKEMSLAAQQSRLRRPNGDGLYFRYFISNDFIRHGSSGLPTVEARVDYNGTRVVGRAWCSPLDKWSPETGRKVALARALKWLPREARRPFWTLYFGRSARFNRELRRCLWPDVEAAAGRVEPDVEKVTTEGEKPCV